VPIKIVEAYVTTLRAKVFFFLTMVLCMPSAVVYLCYGEMLHIQSNATQMQEVQEVAGFVQRNNPWTDTELGVSQALRYRLSYPELQNLFSLWIQARSEGGAHLIQLRAEELLKFTSLKTNTFKTENMFMVKKVTSMLTGLGVFLFGFVVAGYYFMKRSVLHRIAVLESEIGHFRVLDYQTKLPGKMASDEVGDLWFAFRAMVDNLYRDLHENLNVDIEKYKEGQTQVSATVALQDVQAFLVERRTRNDDRRANDRRKGA
jgi:HAMP domain-containing protein